MTTYVCVCMSVSLFKLDERVKERVGVRVRCVMFRNVTALAQHSILLGFEACMRVETIAQVNEKHRKTCCMQIIFGTYKHTHMATMELSSYTRTF